MSITISGLAYALPTKDILFQEINLSIPSGTQASLIGNNGVGKSTLLRLIAGETEASAGSISLSGRSYFVPQHIGQYNHLTVAEALGVHRKLLALHQILDGNASEENFTLLNDDWTIEERIDAAFRVWEVSHIRLNQSMTELSGGEKTKVFLAGIAIHEPEVILLDEPTNHLDAHARELLYDWIHACRETLLIVSHDRKLLNQLPVTYELTSGEVLTYGGNYDFYKNEKEKKLHALHNQLQEKEKELRKAKKIARETMERQQKHEVRGEKSSIKKGIPRIAMKTLKDQAEQTSSRLKGAHEEKQKAIVQELSGIRKQLNQKDGMKLDFGNSGLHRGKLLLEANEINFGYGGQFLWKENLSLSIHSGERIALQGNNGSGKSTLIKLLLKQLTPQVGTVYSAVESAIFVDQEYSIIHTSLSVFEQIEQFNSRRLLEHELKIILNRFLFPKETWDKPCHSLSGGEKMRLLLACLQVTDNVPDLIVLDEPTNNLDIESLGILTSTLKDYQGTLLVVSHDEYFLEEIGISFFIRHCFIFP